MGLASKAFDKIHGTGNVAVKKAAPNFKSASLFGGIIRKKAEPVAVERPIRKSAGELGRIEKAKDAKGHGSEKRGGGSAEQTVDMSRTDGMATYNQLKAQGYKTAWSGEGKIHMVKPPGAKPVPQNIIVGRPADGFDSQKRWGNSAIKGVGVNSPAMMEARAQFAKAKDAGGHGSEKRDYVSGSGKPLNVGDRVEHPKFGTGTVSYLGSGHTLNKVSVDADGPSSILGPEIVNAKELKHID